MADAAASTAPSTAPLTFAAFLEKMRCIEASDIVKAIKAFLTEFATLQPDADRDSERVQEFLRTTEAAFRSHPLWSKATEEELEASGEGLEKYLLTKIYARTFAVVPDDVERDRVLALRLEALQFIRPEHLEIPVHHRNEQAWLLAQNELQKINQYKAPRDKLVCVLNCCRIINNLLNASANTAPPGADDFLPVLVVVLLRAAPPQLASNLAYIARFRLASRLVSETAYFYTNLVSAATFLETAQASQFHGVDEAEFTARMRAKGLPTPGNDSGFSQPAPNTPMSIAAQRASGAVNPFAASPRGSPRARDAAGAAGWGEPHEPPPAAAAAHAPRGAMTGEAPLVTRWTVEELSAVGEAMLASESGDGGGPAQLARKYRFLSTSAGELTLAEVPQLLQEYGALVQRHEALLRGVALMLETSPGGPQQPSAVERGGFPSSASLDALSSIVTPDLIQLQ